MKTRTFSYTEAVSLLTSREKFHIKLGLERIREILEYFNNPQDRIKTVHVAGTNGKGSTCAMLASVLEHAGYKTGLYTSPHLVEYTERFRINNLKIAQDDFAKLLFRVIELIERKNIPATEFEILTAAAFVYFYEQKVDFAVIETGLGGRLDAANTIKKPELTIITDIDLDHTARLGDTIEKIAYEKAGIIKPNSPVITLEDNRGLDVIREKSAQTASPLILTSPKNIEESGLKGIWHARNLSLVKQAVDLLRNKGIKVSEKAEEKGINNTVWPGRFQYIKEENLVIDAAHNPAAARLLRKSLDKHFPGNDRVFIYSSLNTKDYKGVADILFRPEDRVILTKTQSSSASVEPEVLAKCVNNKCKEVYLSQNVKEAVEICKNLYQQRDLIIFTGSIYTIGEFYSSMPS